MNKLVGNGGTRGISIDAGGHVGIGATFPNTTLDVDSGFTIRQVNVPLTSGFASIPSNVSQVAITGSATFPISLFAPFPSSAGQQLTIFNNTSGGYGASMNGYTIPNGQTMTFRSTAFSSTSFLPDVGSNNNVRNISSTTTTVNMLGSDYFVYFHPSVSGATYNLSDPSANSGRSIYLYNSSSVNTVGISCSLGIIADVGSTCCGPITLPTKGRMMLISNGNDWVRMY